MARRWLILGVLLVSLLIFGCTGIQTPLCNPNWVLGVNLPTTVLMTQDTVLSVPTAYGGSTLNDFLTSCKTICYSGAKTTSFKLTIAQTSTCVGNDWSGKCMGSFYINKCWCDVNNCGLSETELS